MAREAWAKQELISASEDVICLAVHRFNDEEWTKRLGVMGYPQILYLDGWGRILDDTQFGRTATQLAESMRSHRSNTKWPDPEYHVPRSLKKRVVGSKRVKAAAVSSDVEQRANAWIELLGIGKWSIKDLHALFEWEEDALVRLEILEMIDSKSLKKKAGTNIIEIATNQKNDYVRLAAMEHIGRSGSDAMVGILNGIMVKVLDGTSPYSNPNNMLLEAAKCSIDVCSVASIPALKRILEQEKSNNGATKIALEALIAIGEEHGLKKVKKALEVALDVESVEGLESLSEALRATAEEALKELR